MIINAENKEKCNVCERFGQFLPVRLAIGFDCKGAGVLTPDNKIIEKLPKLPVGLMYILRRLDDGYIYCYSNGWRFNGGNDNKINCYSVDSSGFIQRINNNDLEVNNNSHEVCLDFYSTSTNAGRSLSEVFLLDLFAKEDTVEILYTRHRLTDETLSELEHDKELRSKIMFEFNIRSGIHERLINKNFESEIIDNLPRRYNNEKTKEILNNVIPWELTENIFFKKKNEYNDQNFLRDLKIHIVEFDSNGNVIPGSAKPHNVTENSIIVLDDPVGIIFDLISIVRFKNKQIDSIKRDCIEYETYNYINELKMWDYKLTKITNDAKRFF